MLDLGTSFLASVARDPNALAIVDGGVRFTYAQWYRRISALVAGFDRLGLKPGDHLVTLLQNNWQAATIHWACQFAGIIITPLNWRSTADELDYCLDNAEAKALVYEGVSADGGEGFGRGRQMPRIAVGLPGDDHLRDAGRGGRAGRAAARRRGSLVGDALHVGHHREAQGRAAPPARRARRGAGPGRAKSLPLRRAHARRHAALSHHGGALAARHVADRRRVRLPAALRRGARAGADRGREDHQPLSGADALPRPGASRALQARPTSRRCARSASPARR